MNILYFDPIGGISGDMILASMIDAGLDIDYLKLQLSKLNITGYNLDIKKTSVEHIGCIKLDIKINESSPKFENLDRVKSLINQSKLDESIKTLSLKIFTNLAQAEAEVHGESYQDVIFHHLSELDTVIDIVGFATGVDYFKIKEFYCSNIKLGRGFDNNSSHKIPIPAPTSLALLKNFPVKFVDIQDEVTTPTAAAVISSTVKKIDTFPEGNLFKIGYSTGSKKFETPNLFRLLILQKKRMYQEDSVIVLETNIDDMNPEGIEYLFEKLISGGALDVYVTNVIMKKSRPGFLITVLSKQHLVNKLCSIIYSECTTLGIRYYKVNRNKLKRKIKIVDTKFGKVKVKIGIGEKLFPIISPEYEECKKIALQKKIPLKMVYEEARRSAQMSTNEKPSD